METETRGCSPASIQSEPVRVHVFQLPKHQSTPKRRFSFSSCFHVSPSAANTLTNSSEGGSEHRSLSSTHSFLTKRGERPRSEGRMAGTKEAPGR